MKILVAVAHPDDEVLGVGGTIAKEIIDGSEVKIIIFSYGENSNILENNNITIKKRIKESRSASKILGSKQISFLGLPDNTMVKALKDPKIIKKFDLLLKNFNPDRIITHSIDDPHPAHAVISRFVKKSVKRSGIKKIEVYTFNVWSPLKLTHRNEPKLVVDISKTYKIKKRALNEFRSQKLWLYYPGYLSLLKDKISGLREGYTAVEVFYKWKI